VPSALLGRIFGILGLFTGIVMILSPVVGGVLWSATGPDYVFLTVTTLRETCVRAFQHTEFTLILSIGIKMNDP
jgi:hypothetical protein